MNDADKPAPKPEDYLRIARLGREFWNRWLRTQLDALIARAESEGRKDYLQFLLTELRLENVTPLGDADWQDRGWERLPELAIPDDPDVSWVSFAGGDFRETAAVVDFSGFSFPPRTSFEGATFGARARFAGATFGARASFGGATFGARVDFAGVTFGYHADFGGATFGAWAGFEGARFGDMANFEGARFGDWAGFAGATFGDWADFAGARFGDRASFEGATFGDWAGFTRATFGDKASFEGRTDAEIGTLVEELAGRLMLAGEEREAWIEHRVGASKPGEFSGISFARAQFEGDCTFSGRTFTGPAGFQNARFGKPPEFAGTEGHGFIDPHGMTVAFPRRWWRLTNPRVDSETTARIRRLRKIMADIHAQDVERDLFILERRAERAIAWNDFAGQFKKSWPQNLVDLFRSLGVTLRKLAGVFRPLGAIVRKLAAVLRPLGTTLRTFAGIFKPLGPTLLLFAYGAASNFGRSIALPFFWLLGSVAAFHAAYWYWWAKPVRALSFWDRDLISYSLGNLLPFVNALSPARGELLKRLFCPTDIQGKCIARRVGELVGGVSDIVVPLRVEGLAMFEGVVNAVLLFLLLQAIRNYFKMK